MAASASQGRARKRFGQNFLIDEAIVERIVTALALRSSDRLLEIGPGRGALTRALHAHSLQRYVGVEIDRDLIAGLRAEFPKLEVINADVLRFDLGGLLAGHRWRLVGNLPYNISTPLLMRVFEHGAHLQDAHVMLQREVAERLTAQPGTKQWGRLSVVAQYHCTIEQLFLVAPESFQPVPKVFSCVVRLVPRDDKLPLAHEEALQRVLRSAFSARRKRIANGLKSLPIAWQRVGVDTDLRADQLTVADYVALANACEEDEQ